MRFILLGSLLSLLCGSALHAAKPIAKIAVIANPYLTTLPAKQIKDENGRVRSHVASASKRGIEKSISVVNRLKPDAVVVLGSLTWSGSKADHQLISQNLNKLTIPFFTVPGHRDRLAGSLEEYHKHFQMQDASKSLQTVNGVSLVFAEDLHSQPAMATKRIQQQLAKTQNAKAALLFADHDGHSVRSKLTPNDKAFWQTIEHKQIAAQIEPTRYGHQLRYTNTLPIWTVGSSGWSGRDAVTLISVYEDHIDMQQVGAPGQPSFALSIPNPVNKPRMKAAKDDQYGCPSYSLDLAAKPEFTFALIADPQFDRETNRATLINKSKAIIAELNRLNPAMVFVAGDLVNNNLPEEWKLFNELFSKLKPNKVVVPGNHDVLFNYNFIEKSYSSAPKDKPKYAELVKKALVEAKKEGYTGPAALFEKYTKSKPQQRIEHKNCAFITVPFLTQRADTEQIAFLRQALNQSKNNDHVFVIAHYPSLNVFGNNVQPKLGGEEVLSLLLEHRVTGYLFGHRHRNGFHFHERTAHVLTDNCYTIHLLHVFKDRVILGRKRVGSPLYEKLTIRSPRMK